MPRKNGPRQPNRQGTPESDPSLYIGCFTFDRPGEPDHEGSFQLVVEARSPEEADGKCRRRLKKLRTTTTLFDDPVTIYMTGFVELSGSLKDGLLINYEDGPAPPPPIVRIGCLIPEQEDHEAECYTYEPESAGRKKGEDVETKPFVDFGGIRFRDALQKHSGARSGGLMEEGARSRSPSAEADRQAREATRTERANARAEAQARRERRAALRSTLSELREAKGTARHSKKPEPLTD